MNDKQKAALDSANLAHFSGSTCFYRHWLPGIIMTEGVHHITENGAAWLVDVVASVQRKRDIKAEDFQVWTLSKVADKEGDCWVICSDGNGNVLYRQHIPYTDFPFDTLTLYAARNEQGGITIMLPGEY